MSAHLIPIYFVDAFTTNGNSPFTGNGAAVCFLDYDDEVSDEIKQKIASEINLSETAFISYGWTPEQRLVTAEGSQLHRRTIRWFTPTNEVELCGHATVASTKAIVEAQLTDKYLDPNVKTITINFESKYKGKLGAAVNKANDRITLNFPSNPTHQVSKNLHSSWIHQIILTTLGEKVSPSSVKDLQYSPGTQILLLRLESPSDINWTASPAEYLRKVAPDFKKLLTINTGDLPVRGVIVTVKGEAERLTAATEKTDIDNEGNVKEIPHFYSRFFAPWDGIDEDPVTGLAHTVLTPYWTSEITKTLQGENAVGTLLGRQHSLRGGNVYCTLVGDRVNLAGEARITIKGQLSI